MESILHSPEAPAPAPAAPPAAEERPAAATEPAAEAPPPAAAGALAEAAAAPSAATAPEIAPPAPAGAPGGAWRDSPESRTAEAAAAKSEANRLSARARDLRSPLANMRALLLKNLPKLGAHLSSGGAIAARNAASMFMTSWFERRGRAANVLAKEAEEKLGEARRAQGRNVDPVLLAELLAPRGGAVGVAVLPLEDLLRKAPDAARPLVFRGGVDPARERLRQHSATATARIASAAALACSRAITGIEAGTPADHALSAIAELEALKVRVKRSGGDGRSVVRLDGPPPAPRPRSRSPSPAEGRPSPLRARSSALHAPRPPQATSPPVPRAAAPSPPPAAAAPGAAPRRGAGGLSQSKNAATRPRFPDGGSSLISALADAPRGAPPVLDVPPEAVPFLRALGLPVEAPLPPTRGARPKEHKPPPGPWPEEMFNASQFGVNISDDGFPATRRKLEELRKTQKRALEVQKLKRAYSPIKIVLPQ